MRSIEISVIVPIYNGERHVASLIAGLAKQSYPAEAVEYIVVDNRSTDRTREEAAPAIALAQSAGIDVRVISEVEIQGSYAARNAGIRAARGDIIAFTDADCRADKNWLTELVRPFADPTVGVTAGRIAPFSDHSWIERYSASRGAVSQEGALNNRFRPYGLTANLAVRKEVFDKVGMFRPHLRSGGDADLCWRATADGFQLQFASNALVHHRHRTTVAGLVEQYSRYATGAFHLSTLFGFPLPAQSVGRYLAYQFPTVIRWRALQAIQLRRPEFLSYVVLDVICFRAQQAGLAQAATEHLNSDIPELR